MSDKCDDKINWDSPSARKLLNHIMEKGRQRKNENKNQFLEMNAIFAHGIEHSAI